MHRNKISQMKYTVSKLPYFEPLFGFWSVFQKSAIFHKQNYGSRAN
jgi:hypothetical protein